MPKPVEIQLPRIHQEIIACDARFKIICAGRGFGKTPLMLAEGLRDLTRNYTSAFGEPMPSRILYVAPIRDEARKLVWGRAKRLLEPFTVAKPNEARLEIPLINGAQFILSGARQPNNLRGDYVTLLLLDEYAFFEPEGMTVDEMWQEVFRPMLSKTVPAGRAVKASSPDGHNWFYDDFQKGLSADPRFRSWRSWQYRSVDGGFMTEKEVEDAKVDSTLAAWEQEYLGKFVASSNRIYFAFDQQVHVKKINFLPELDIHWFWDFNVNPCVHSGIAHIEQGKAFIFDEFCVGETPDNVHAFMDKYPATSVHGIKLYGDYSGNITTTGISDYQMIEQILLTNGYPKPELRVYGGNPMERDRTNNVNRLLRNANDEVSLYVDERNCKKLIADFKNVRRDRNNGKIDKKFDPTLTHQTDALGYCLAVALPPSYGDRARTSTTSRDIEEINDFGYWVEKPKQLNPDDLRLKIPRK